MIPFRESEHHKMKEIKNLFDDSYKKKEDSSSINMKKFENNYVKGQMKTNVVFDDTYVFI